MTTRCGILVVIQQQGLGARQNSDAVRAGLNLRMARTGSFFVCRLYNLNLIVSDRRTKTQTHSSFGVGSLPKIQEPVLVCRACHLGSVYTVFINANLLLRAVHPAVWSRNRERRVDYDLQIIHLPVQDFS